MQRPMPWVRHLQIAGGFFVIAMTGITLWHWQTFSHMFANMGALSEGKALAEAMQSPDDVVAYLRQYPDQASLVAFDLDTEGKGIAWQAQETRATAGLMKLQLLDAYVRQTKVGDLDSTETVAWQEWERFYLPGADQGYLQRRQTEWAGGPVALQTLMDAALNEGDPISTDVVFDRLVREQPIDSVFVSREGIAAPLPLGGIFLSWNNHTLEAPLEDRVASYAGMDAIHYSSLVVDLMNEYTTNAAFQDLERELRTDGYAAIRLVDQRALALHTFPKGSAQAYANYVAELVDSTSASAFREHWFHDVSEGGGQALFQAWGSVTGSFPGMFSFVGYAEREGKPPRVVVLLLEDVPLAVYYHLTQTSLDKGVPLLLLADDDFFERTRRALSNDSRRTTATQ